MSPYMRMNVVLLSYVEALFLLSLFLPIDKSRSERMRDCRGIHLDLSLLVELACRRYKALWKLIHKNRAHVLGREKRRPKRLVQKMVVSSFRHYRGLSRIGMIPSFQLYLRKKMKRSPKKEGKGEGSLKVCDEYVAEYYPDILSNYSNSSGTISYDSVLTPRRPEHREIRFAAEGTVPNEQCYFAREIELLPPPLKPEPVDWDLLKRLNKLLEYKERTKKTIEIQRAEKGTLEQSKQVIEQALLKFLARPAGMAMNISTVPNSKPARLAIKVCPTERMRTASAPVLTMEALANTFHTDPNFITEAELVREQTKLFRKRVEKRQEAAAKKPTRPTFPKDPPVHESRSYGPPAMAQEYHGTTR